MAYCSNCGQQLADNAKFCAHCGTSTDNDNGKRKTVYEGEIHKCPNCGEVLPSFVSKCPACGCELRGAKSLESVHQFEIRLENAKSVEQQAVIIRNYPIPNTKEDIIEFMILASTNMTGELQSEVSEAWIAKFEQCFHKAKLIFSNDADFAKMQSIYEQTYKQINKVKTAKHIKKAGKTISNNSIALVKTAVVIGWLISVYILIPLCGTNLDIVGFNACQLLLIADFIVGAIGINFLLKGGENLPRIVSVVGLLISVVIIIPLCIQNVDSVGFNAYQIILIFDIATSAIIVRRVLKKPRNN